MRGRVYARATAFHPYRELRIRVDQCSRMTLSESPLVEASVLGLNGGRPLILVRRR